MEKNDLKQYIIDNLDRALEEKWITVYYQPIVRAVNGRVCDEEALARWIDPEKGFLSPAEFIPILEETKLIYKVDLFVLEQVLEKIKYLTSKGFHSVSHSINLSRSDYDVCDMVEEICTRIDKAGVERNKINIEITESILSNDFGFMLEQIKRFKSLGFSVWMDDFGSGYSSLNVLQRIPYDLIKFDMAFLKNIDKGESGKIILAELMQMAASPGKDTVCEGVETKEQMEFLQEIGCSKMQGYYYSKPISLEQILERYKTGTQIGFENPEESQYCQMIGSVNLHDLSVLNQSKNNSFSNFFNTLPMAIMEIDSEMIRYVRANKAYGEFMEKYFFMKQDRTEVPIKLVMQGPGAAFLLVLKQAAKEGKPMFVDEKLPEGSKAHYYITKITENPLTKRTAIVVAILSVRSAGTSETYENIAHALATDYFKLFYVNLETEEYIEYIANTGEDELSTEKPGKNFFAERRAAAPEHVYEDDLPEFLEVFNKETITKRLDEQGTFVITYRLLKYGMPYYVSMKIMRMPDNKNKIIIGISNIDTLMRQKLQLEEARHEQLFYSRVMALSSDYICIYLIDVKTNSYIEYQANSEFQSIGIQKNGKDFFADTQANAEKAVYGDDCEQFLFEHTKENILSTIEKNGVFKSRHRLLINGQSVPVNVRCVLIKENGVDKLIMGVRKM